MEVRVGVRRVNHLLCRYLTWILLLAGLDRALGFGGFFLLSASHWRLRRLTRPTNAGTTHSGWILVLLQPLVFFLKDLVKNIFLRVSSNVNCLLDHWVFLIEAGLNHELTT